MVMMMTAEKKMLGLLMVVGVDDVEEVEVVVVMTRTMMYSKAEEKVGVVVAMKQVMEQVIMVYRMRWWQLR